MSKVKTLVALLAMLACIPAFAKGGFAQAEQPIPVEVAAGKKQLMYPTAASADGAMLAFTVYNPRNGAPYASGDSEEALSSRTVPAKAFGGEIWIKNIATRETQVIASPGSANWAATWSPNSQSLAFLSNRDGEVRVWMWSRSTGRIRKVSDAIIMSLDLQGLEAKLDWLPDGVQMSVSLAPEGKERGAPKVRSVAGPEDVTVSMFSSLTVPPANDQRRTDVRTVDLGVLDVESGTVRRFASKIPALDCGLAPNGEWLACNIWSGRSEGDEAVTRLVVMSVEDGKKLLEIAAPKARHAGYSWSPTSRYLVIDTAEAKSVVDTSNWTISVLGDQWQPRRGVVGVRNVGLWSRDGQFFYTFNGSSLSRVQVGADNPITSMPLRSGTIPWSALNPVRDFQGHAFQPLGSDALVLWRQEPETSRYEYYTLNPATGESETLYVVDSGGTGECVLGIADAIIACVEGSDQGADLWRFDLSGGTVAAALLVDIDPEYASYRPGTFRSLDAPSTAGQTLKHALLLPSAYQSGRRYPLVVWVYGGEREIGAIKSYPSTRVFDFQVLATRGYTVMIVAAPLRVGSPMKDLASAVLPAVEKAVELGIADPDRIAVMGNSYGGYSVKALLVQSTRFKAAISSVGSGGNLFLDYSTFKDDGRDVLAGLETGQKRMGTTPWQDRNRYIENSPFFYYDRIHTPLLMMAGVDDNAVPLKDHNETFVALRRLGKEVEYLRYAGESHALIGFGNIVDFWNRRLAFLAKHLDLTLDEHGAIIFDGDLARSQGAAEPVAGGLFH